MAMNGRRHTAETRRKMRESQTGHVMPSKTRERLEYARTLKINRELAAQGVVMSEKLPGDRTGVTMRFKIHARGEERADGSSDVREVRGYLIMNTFPDGQRLREIFVRVGKPGSSDAMWDEWAKQTNMRLQSGASVEDVFRRHIGTRFGDSGRVDCVKGIKRCTSVLDLIAQITIQRFGAKEEQDEQP
jgi:hypothetical protein